MRFLFLTQYFPPETGASPIRLANTIRELGRLGHEVEVVTAFPNYPAGKIYPDYRGKLYAREQCDNVTIHRVWLYPATGAGLKRILNYASFTASSLFGLVRARKPDYLFVDSPPLFLTVPAVMAARCWRVPMIFNVADLWPDSVRVLGLLEDGPILRFAENLEAWSYRNAAYVTAVTDGIYDDLIKLKNVPASKVLFLPNGVDSELFKPGPPDQALAHELGLTTEKVIVYAGILGIPQGLQVALNAMKRLEDDLADVKLIFIGSGSEHAMLRATATELQLKNVMFLSPQPPEYVARLYSLAYAGFASLKNVPLFEGARPSKIFPVMASAKPVIYSGAGEGARIVQEANAGVTVAPEDPEALATAIKALVGAPETAEKYGRSGRQYVEQNLRWRTLVEDWLNQLTSSECGNSMQDRRSQRYGDGECRT